MSSESSIDSTPWPTSSSWAALAQMKATNPALENYTSRADFEKEFLIGTPDAIVHRLKAYTDLGVTHFMLWFMDFPALDGVEIFAEEVMPHFR